MFLRERYGPIRRSVSARREIFAAPDGNASQFLRFVPEVRHASPCNAGIIAIARAVCQNNSRFCGKMALQADAGTGCSSRVDSSRGHVRFDMFDLIVRFDKFDLIVESASALWQTGLPSRAPISKLQLLTHR